MTVIEVSLALLILGIAMAGALNFLDRASILTIRTDSHASAEDATQQALRRVTQELRAATPVGAPCTAATDTASPSLPAGYDNCVQFTVQRTSSGLDPCSRTVHVFALVPTDNGVGQLVENRTRYAGTGTGATCPGTVEASRRVLLDKVVTGGGALFTWLRGDGSVIPTTSAAASTDVPKASSVRVAVAVRYSTQAPPLSSSSVAALRNNISR
ncbi:MAG TPA: hypothetical protein VM938_08435 [Acidimicrobiales bacterium]|nr:hypothetical protein [Acidimicrobiales bacterium]